MNKTTKKQAIDISEDIKRGFVISQGKEVEKFKSYYSWCKKSNQISVAVRLCGSMGGVKIDTIPRKSSDRTFRFSDDQVDELLALAQKHHWKKWSNVSDIFSLLKFAKDDALAFAADVAKWIKTATILPPAKPMRTCGECQRLIQCREDSVLCDWVPSRFQEKADANRQIEVPSQLGGN